jgi:peptidoglycan pentaglycine glycine transferase (the first glycine)
VKFVYIDQSLQKQWETLVKSKQSSGFMQSFFWADFKRNSGWETFKIGITENGRLVGGAIVMKYYFGPMSFLYIPEGPILPYTNEAKSKDLLDKLIKEIDTLVTYWGRYPTTHLRIEPRLSSLPSYATQFTKSPFNMEPKQTRMINVRLTDDQLLSQMKPKGRYNIKIAQKYGIEVIKDDSKKGLKTFLKLYHPTKKRNDFKGKEDWYFEKLFSLMEGRGTFYIAHQNGKPLAASLTLFFGKRVTYFYGASSNTDKEKMAPYLLHYHIMQEAREKGYHWYDLWGISENESDEKNSWYGFTQFKKQFGGKRFDFMCTYDLVYNKRLYQKYLKDSNEI